MTFKNALIEDIKLEYFHEYSLPDEYLERILLVDSANERVPAEDKLVEVAVSRCDAIKVYKYNCTINFMRVINKLPDKDLMSCHVICRDKDIDSDILSFEIPVNTSENIASAPVNILNKIENKDVNNPIILYRVVAGNGTNPLRHEFDILDMRKDVEAMKKSYYGVRSEMYYSIVDKLDGYYTDGLNVYALNRAFTNIILRAAPDIDDTIITNTHTEVCKLEDAKLINYDEEFFYAESLFYDNKDVTKNSKLDKDKLEKLKKGNFHKLGPVLYQLSKTNHVLDIKVSVIIETK